MWRRALLPFSLKLDGGYRRGWAERGPLRCRREERLDGGRADSMEDGMTVAWYRGQREDYVSARQCSGLG